MNSSASMPLLGCQRLTIVLPLCPLGYLHLHRLEAALPLGTQDLQQPEAPLLPLGSPHLHRPEAALPLPLGSPHLHRPEAPPPYPLAPITCTGLKPCLTAAAQTCALISSTPASSICTGAEEVGVGGRAGDSPRDEASAPAGPPSRDFWEFGAPFSFRAADEDKGAADTPSPSICCTRAMFSLKRKQGENKHSGHGIYDHPLHVIGMYRLCAPH